jgi:hypothetical protein
MVTLAVVVLGAAGTVQGWTAVDDFESYASGSQLDGQGSWVRTRTPAPPAVAAFTVIADPTAAGNQILHVTDDTHWGDSTIAQPLAMDADGVTTLSFRMYALTKDVSTGTVHDLGVGMSNAALGATWSNLQGWAMLWDGADVPPLDIRSRNGASYTDLAAATEGVWYQLWLVYNMSSTVADTYDIYIQGGTEWATQTQIANDFLFRTVAGVAQLLSLEIITGEKSPGEYVDDIYVASGQDLSNPIPEPATMGLLGLGLAGLALKRRGRK